MKPSKAITILCLACGFASGFGIGKAIRTAKEQPWITQSVTEDLLNPVKPHQLRLHIIR